MYSLGFMLTRGNILRELSDKRNFSFNFLMNINGQERHYLSKVVRTALEADAEVQDNARYNVIVGLFDDDERVREEIRQKDVLREAIRTAEKASRAKSDFLFNMSHDIRIDSVQGEGTTVRCFFTFDKAAPAAAEEAEEVEVILPAGKRILLVDDNELNREIAMDLLEDLELEVEEAADGTEAVEKVSAAGAGYYDVVLMDVQMPKMTGYEAAPVHPRPAGQGASLRPHHRHDRQRLRGGQEERLCRRHERASCKAHQRG